MHRDEPKDRFKQAEALRKENKHTEAQKQYRDTVRLSHERSQARGESRSDRTRRLSTSLNKNLYSFFIIPLMIAGIVFSIFRVVAHDFDKQKSQTDPKSFTFVEWLVLQQTTELMENLADANPNLSFDFSRSASALTPQEAMQSLMSKRLQDQLRAPGDGNNSERSEGNGDGPPNFSCSVDKVQQCSEDALPSAPGEMREDIAQLVRSYRTVLNNEKDCSNIASAIEALGNKIQWRNSERRVKAELEHLALSCFARSNDYQKTIEQARRLQCTGSTSAMNTSYWYLTASHAQLGELDTAERMYTCFKETVDHLTEFEFTPSSIASRRRESGALAWLYFNDLDTAVRELEVAREILQKARVSSPQLSYVASEIDLDLMETYVTANIDYATFTALHEDINTSGLLTDGYKQIKDTLAGIYYLQNRKNTEAAVALSNVAKRFKHLPEYICSWDWSGFQRGLADSIKDPVAREKADKLVVATNCYVPQSIEDRIQKVNEVLRWLKR